MEFPNDYLNKVLQGDCLEVMKGIPDKSIDLVLTDPPYEAEAHTLQRRKSKGGKLVIAPLDFPPMTEELRLGIAKEITRVAKGWVLTFCQVEAAHIWIKAYQDAGLNYRRTCIWVKPDGMPQYSGDRPGMGYETIVAMHVPGASKWNGGGSHGVWTFPKGDNGGKANLHPTTKPRKLIGNLLNLFSNQGDLILDPFLGSGTTAVCCQGNRNFIGIEIDPKYVKVAEDRLKQQVLNF